MNLKNLLKSKLSHGQVLKLHGKRTTRSLTVRIIERKKSIMIKLEQRIITSTIFKHNEYCPNPPIPIIYIQHSNKNKHSDKIMTDFETELEQKLTKLSATRSQKKIRSKPLIDNMNSIRGEIDLYSRIVLTEQGVSGSGAKEKEKDYSDRKESARMEKGKESRREEEKSKNQAAQLIGNKQLSQFVSRNFAPNYDKIDLSVFLARSLAEYSHAQQLPQQQITPIFLELQSQITTTDPNTVSLNALELAVKKFYGSFQMYIGEKIVRAGQEARNGRLKVRERNFQKMVKEGERELERRDKLVAEQQKKLSEQQKSIKQKEKQLAAKEKAYNLKEKQLMERIKGHKKMLEQRSQKLTEQFVQTIHQAYEKIEKKINTYQRNMKYRVQSLNHKVNQAHSLRQFKVTDLRNAILKEIEDKYQKAYGQKMRKQEQQMKQMIEKYELVKRQVKQYEEQNNKLAKIVTKLEAKISKQETKIKELQDFLTQKKKELKELQAFCVQKDKQNEEIMAKLMVNREQSQIHDQSITEKRVKRSESKKGLSNRKSSQPNQQLAVIQLVEVYEHALKQAIEKETTLDKYLIKGTLSLSITLIVGNGGYFCGYLLQFVYKMIMETVCGCLVKQGKARIKQVKGILNLLLQCYPEQSNSFVQYLRKQKKKKNKQQQKHAESLWKLQAILCFLSKKQSRLWMAQLYDQSQSNQTHEQMVHEMENTSANFFYALLIKEIYCSSEGEIQPFSVVADLSLELNAVGHSRNEKFWKAVGNDLLTLYAVWVKNALANKEIFQQTYEKLQKISILVQRLVVGHQLPIQTDTQSIFSAIASKCQGTLLSRNLKSIIQTSSFRNYEGHNILAQLQDQ